MSKRDESLPLYAYVIVEETDKQRRMVCATCHAENERWVILCECGCGGVGLKLGGTISVLTWGHLG